MQYPKAIFFDVDDTLAESFQPPKPSMMERVKVLLDHTTIALISGAGFGRIEKDFLSYLVDSPHAKRLFVFPNSSAQGYSWTDGWNEEYGLEISQEERQQIEECMRRVDPSPDPRALVLDRGVQVAYAMIGLHASLEEKLTWDSDQSKRKRMKEQLEKMLPEYEVLIGGTTTLDVTRKGVNKAYGVQWLAERLKCEPSDMLYIGDALYPGGNDYVVIATGIPTKKISGPAETENVIDELLNTYA